MKTNPVFSSVDVKVTTLFILLLTACSEKPPELKAPAVPVPPMSSASTAEPTRAVAAQPTKSDPEKELAARVKTALANDKELSGEGIDVTVTQSVAHLWGTVRNATEQKRAEELAMSVHGITSVDDKLAVVSGS